MGEKLAKELGSSYVDCDDLYTDDELVSINLNKFTSEDSEIFLKRCIETLSKYSSELLVASQSLFKDDHRKRLKAEFDKDIYLVYLDVPEEIIYQRLRTRKKSFYTVEQYFREAHEYQDVGTVDLVIYNGGCIDQAISKLKRGLTI